jgi:hypothetical protein
VFTIIAKMAIIPISNRINIEVIRIQYIHERTLEEILCKPIIDV